MGAQQKAGRERQEAARGQEVKKWRINWSCFKNDFSLPLLAWRQPFHYGHGDQITSLFSSYRMEEMLLRGSFKGMLLFSFITMTATFLFDLFPKINSFLLLNIADFLISFWMFSILHRF